MSFYNNLYDVAQYQTNKSGFDKVKFTKYYTKSLSNFYHDYLNATYTNAQSLTQIITHLSVIFEFAVYFVNDLIIATCTT